MKCRTCEHQDKCAYLVGVNMSFRKVSLIFQVCLSFFEGDLQQCTYKLVDAVHYFSNSIKLKQSKFYKHIFTVIIISRKTFEKVPQTFTKTELSREKNCTEPFFKYKQVDCSYMQETTSAIFQRSLLQLLLCSMNS